VAHAGLSVDWSLTYRTIDDNSQSVAQSAFLKNLERGEAYRADAPTLWDITFRTAVAQAELEDREQPSAYHKVTFHGVGKATMSPSSRRALNSSPPVWHWWLTPMMSATSLSLGPRSRLPCLVLRFRSLPTTLPNRTRAPASRWSVRLVTSPTLFGGGSSLLDTRPILGKDGRIIAETPSWISTPAGPSLCSSWRAKTVFSAKAAMVEMLRESGDLQGDPDPMVHPVKFFEKGDKPLEIVTTRQWYIRNGARDEDLKQRLLQRGTEVAFHPDFMRVRYENWVNGLSGDWLISRQRFFGVPIPVWYPLDDQGNPVEGEVITPEPDQLPVDPSSDTPPGFSEDQRGVPGGFIGELDIMDTWATSSLTPQLAGGWGRDEELFSLVFPYDLRSQGQDIIRTWLFSTMLACRARTRQHPLEKCRHFGLHRGP
jgi:valyl-tRNA synthetase